MGIRKQVKVYSPPYFRESVLQSLSLSAIVVVKHNPRVGGGDSQGEKYPHVYERKVFRHFYGVYNASTRKQC